MNNVFELLGVLLQVYSYILLARALISWIPNLDPLQPDRPASLPNHRARTGANP